MEINKTYSNKQFKGTLINNDDDLVFEFQKGESHANLMPGGVMPNIYRAKIGSAMCERYPWTDFIIGKCDVIQDFNVKNTSALLFQCIITLLKSNNINVKTWKSNMHIQLPTLTEYANNSRITSATSAAARALVNAGIIVIDGNDMIKVKDGNLRDIKKVISNTYQIYLDCKEWLATGESGVKVGVYKDYSMQDTPRATRTPNTETKQVEIDLPLAKPANTEIRADSIGASDLVGRSFGAVNGTMIEIDTSKGITFIDGIIKVSTINGSVYDIDRIYYKPEDAMKAAFGL